MFDNCLEQTIALQSAVGDPASATVVTPKNIGAPAIIADAAQTLAPSAKPALQSPATAISQTALTPADAKLTPATTPSVGPSRRAEDRIPTTPPTGASDPTQPPVAAALPTAPAVATPNVTPTASGAPAPKDTINPPNQPDINPSSPVASADAASPTPAKPATGKSPAKRTAQPDTSPSASETPAPEGELAPATPQSIASQLPSATLTPTSNGQLPQSAAPQAQSDQKQQPNPAQPIETAEKSGPAGPRRSKPGDEPPAPPPQITATPANPAVATEPSVTASTQHAAPPAAAPAASPVSSAAAPHAAAPAPASPIMQVAQAVTEPVRVVLAAPPQQPGAPHVTTIQLDPVELGRVEIRIERINDGPAKIELAAARPETLLRLLHDQPQLQQALDQAGIPQQGRTISFSLAPENGNAGGAFSSFNGDSAAGGNGQRSQQGYQNASGPDTIDTLIPTPVRTRTGLDITA